MKKFIVKYKDSEIVIGEYNSREEASEKLMNYINNLNDGLEYSHITLFDFVLKEVECKEVSEEITDFESARKAIDGKPNEEFIVVKKRCYKNVIQIEDVERLVNEINPKHIEALIALNRLFTIAEAWNKIDGFVPDFSNWHQDKYFPWFEYENKVAGFVCTSTYKTGGFAGFHICSRICFKTHERAEQFGKQFADLYNKVFL